MKRQLRLACCVLIGLLMLVSTSIFAKCDSLTITEMNWPSSQVVTEVSKFIIENGYGCKVKKIPSSTIPAITSVAETNQPDIITEIWHDSVPKYAELEAEGKVVTVAEVLSDGGGEGWWIPQYLADEHPEIQTIQDILDNPSVVGGKFHNCPVGWGCRVVNDNLKVVYKLEENGIEVFDHGSGETLSASIASAYANKMPWFGYYWAPTAILGKYPMKKIDIGPINEEVHKCNQKLDCADIGISGYPSAKVVTGVTRSFLEKNAPIFDLMSNVSFSTEVMNSLLAWKEKNNATSEEAAVHFLLTRSDLWATWLSDGAREKLSKLINFSFNP